MNRIELGPWIAVLLVFLSVPSDAAEIDRYDLDSISLQPAYISPRLLRQSSCLRAVAVSPPNRTATSPGTPIAIAVGDAGAILRSDDAGETWQAVEIIRLEAPIEESRFGRTPPQSDNSLPIPFCGFTDILWASPLDVIAVGGGYEPVTGISRGVCLFSRDGGLTWYLSDAHELPRLHKIRMGGPASGTMPAGGPLSASRRNAERELAPGVLEAIGDTSEASGVNRFYSYDGAQTWVEDIRTASTLANQDAAQAGTTAPNSRQTIQTLSGRATVNGLSAASDDGQFAVSSHGRIWRRADSHSPWQCVRGQRRRTGVLFIANSPATVPWSLAGRESLHENRRTAILIDAAEAATVDDLDSGRCRAAASMLGISDVNCVSDGAQRMEWLMEHQPAVVVLDESLSPEIQRAWIAAIDEIRTRPFSQASSLHSHPTSASTLAGDWTGPQRIILTRRVVDDFNQDTQRSSNAWYQNDRDPRWQRAWKHTSVLRSSALLSGPGTLAADLAVDALMLAAPQQTAPQAIEIATLEDMSGSVRRDVALAAGAALTEGQNRNPAETFTASNRRLQISSARMSQTRRLHDELFSATSYRDADQSRLKDKIEQLLAVTAAEDRTRLLWEAMAETMTSESKFSALPGVLLSLLARHGQPAAVRRWAALNEEAWEASIERRSLTSLDQITAHRRDSPNVLGNVAGDLDRRSAHDESNAAEAGGAARGQTISPFQIAPVSYEAEMTPPPQVRGVAPRQPNFAFDSAMGAATKTGPAIILVPERKPVQWQPTRGWTSLVAPLNSKTGSSGLKPIDNKASDEPARINWDYHPIVMAARGITPQNVANDESNEDLQSGKESTRQAACYEPPRTSDRPLLDGQGDDRCWTIADQWQDDGFQAKCVADEEFLYLAIDSSSCDLLRLSLDCDGDYFTAMRFEIARDGSRRVRVDGVGATSPVWYSASTCEADSADPGAVQQRVLTEVAIARASLPAPVCRVHVHLVRPGGSSQWQVMPEANEWHPQR